MQRIFSRAFAFDRTHADAINGNLQKKLATAQPHLPRSVSNFNFTFAFGAAAHT